MAGELEPGQQRPVFLPVILAVTLVLLGVYLAIHIGLVSTRFMPALNHPDPPLSKVNPMLGPAPPRLARRVFLVIVDGLRLRDSYGLDYLDSLRRRGVDSSATSHYPSISRPNYVTIVTGVPPTASGVRTNDYNTVVRLDSLMDRARDHGMRVAFAADYTNGLPVMFTRESDPDKATGEYDSAFFEANLANWPGGLQRTIERMIDVGYPLLIAIPGAVDEAGHEYGGESPQYRQAIRSVDRMLQTALSRFDFHHDALIITADHGHTDAGGHGGREPEVMEVPLIMVGAGIRAGAAVSDARLIDIAPTCAALLGMPAPGHGLGRTLTQALILDPGSRRVLEDADRKRIVRNRMLVEAWFHDGKQRATRARIWRIPLVLVLAAFGVVVIAWLRHLDALEIDWRVVAIALPAFPISYYALLAVFGQAFSPSSVPARGSLVALLFRFGMISTTAHIIVSWFAFRGRVVLAERLATANGLFVCGLFGSVFSVGVVWAIWPGPFIIVPSPALLVLIPATYVACACYGLAVVATLSLEIVVFFARAVDPRTFQSTGHDAHRGG